MRSGCGFFSGTLESRFHHGLEAFADERLLRRGGAAGEPSQYTVVMAAIGGKCGKCSPEWGVGEDRNEIVVLGSADSHVQER